MYPPDMYPPPRQENVNPPHLILTPTLNLTPTLTLTKP